MKILIIKPSSFGDIVQALPSANALKQAYPKCKISWVVFKNWEDIPKLCPDIDEIITWDRKSGVKGFLEVLSRLRRTKYDIILDLQGLLRSACLAKFAKAKIKIGVPGMKEFSNFLIKEVCPEKANTNATLRNLEPVKFLIGKAFQPKVNIKIDIDVNNILNNNRILKDFIAFVPFARGKGKNWDVNNYHKLISLIRNKFINIQIVVLGLKSDFGKLQSNQITDLCGKTSIEELAGILSKSKVVVGADTGPMHLAAILNVPTVFIFGCSNIHETAPYLGKFSLLINKENKDNINAIKPETVFWEIGKWIK
ncbi:MAG: glycosyltransferase family 9 protein [Endomicrobium sp.]|jgi:ADP-heptose:LPS heptosyltransferase|uniref:glycosyltransferase family 9 protein n=1 Tax=Candidatus Endomicrobiellum cubanum TaxID=3242325 RepID=UPI002819BD2F|nr:glycosyltransferase family 9 protein [Endomicrobium sp.]